MKTLIGFGIKIALALNMNHGIRVWLFDKLMQEIAKDLGTTVHRVE